MALRPCHGSHHGRDPRSSKTIEAYTYDAHGAHHLPVHWASLGEFASKFRTPSLARSPYRAQANGGLGHAHSPLANPGRPGETLATPEYVVS